MRDTRRSNRWLRLGLLALAAIAISAVTAVTGPSGGAWAAKLPPPVILPSLSSMSSSANP